MEGNQGQRVFMQTFGCQMNEHDTQQMQFVLSNSGYEIIPDIKDAGVVVINTCSVREKPENKIYSLLGRLRLIKKTNPKLVIGVGGCVARQEKENIFKRAPWVDIVFGPDNYILLPKMIARAKKGEKVLDVEWKKQMPKFEELKFTNQTDFARRINSGKAYIAITKGCDNFCSFCIVPFTRGREMSRSLESILIEAKELISSGAKELTLVGQNVNSYFSKETDFYSLLNEVSSLAGVERLRFVSPHPKDWNDKLSALMASKKNICNQLHLPFQSGSTRILKMMRRDHSIENYLKKIATVKKLIPDIELSTDVIVGFPGETQEDFQGTLRVLSEVGFVQVFGFKYSPRKGTRAANMPDDVSLPIKDARLAELIALQKKIVKTQLQKYIGKTIDVLIERVDSTVSPNMSVGKSAGSITVKIAGRTKTEQGEIYPIKIIGIGETSLLGER
ncbi:MAG: tRNA (N6-isopentenyl adenosine(37)-C2)-methylthiotransferase MiaB [SAR324 cluster bacterium]|nr:tRNA (N6-isopentenyl adenosine(37)-C2)-methylthiotransferase MiaB [SAR324 cluster bacterium]